MTNNTIDDLIRWRIWRIWLAISKLMRNIISDNIVNEEYYYYWWSNYMSKIVSDALVNAEYY